MYSNCCGAYTIHDDYGICPDCKEHCDFLTEEELEEQDNEIPAYVPKKKSEMVKTQYSPSFCADDNNRGGTGHGDESFSDADPGL